MDTRTVSPPTATLPPRPKRPLRLSRGWSIGLVILVLVIAFAFFVPPTAGYLAGIVSTLRHPAELKGASFLSDSAGGTVSHTAQILGFSHEALAGTLVSADDRAPGSARIIRSVDGKYHLLLDGTEAFATSTPLASVSRSPDGTKVAYAYGTRAPFQYPYELPITSTDVQDWHVAIFTPAARMHTYVGEGYAPLFIDDAHLVRFATGGILVVDFSTGQTSVALAQPLSPVFVSVLQSPDRSLIAWRDTRAHTLTVYRADTTGVQKVAVIPSAKGIASYALGNDALYIVRLSPFGSGIWKQGFSDAAAHQIMMLPVQLDVTRLVLGAI